MQFSAGLKIVSLICESQPMLLFALHDELGSPMIYEKYMLGNCDRTIEIDIPYETNRKS